MSNPKNISLLAIMLLLINLNTNPVNSEMRKSWSRKTTPNVTTEQASEQPLSSRDIMKYFQANTENSDFESVFSDKTELEDEITTETSDKLVATTIEVSSDDLKVEASEKEVVVETINDDTDTGVADEEDIREGKEEENSNERRNMTQAERDIIRQGLNLIVLGRGKKNNWIERIVPLFILPFLIQSAIIPFIVQAIKLLLLKSLFVGKTALLLFLLGFFRNMKGGHHRSGAPYYLKEYAGNGPDDRLYEPYANEHGYQAEGAPYFVQKRSSKKSK